MSADSEKRWFYLASTMTFIFSGYLVMDLYNKANKKKKKDQPVQSPKSPLPIRKRSMPFKGNSDDLLRSQFKLDEQTRTNKRIYKIVITGGPCAGKTSGMTMVQNLLVERGFRVFIVPEVIFLNVYKKAQYQFNQAATLLSEGGAMINLSKYNMDQQIRFQQALMKMQMSCEDRFTEIALLDDQQSVILCDRGVMDGSAYMDPISWQVLLDEMGVNAVQLRDKRYDAVIHMVTAADGAAEYYNLGNRARYEVNLEDAINVDQKLQNAWASHPQWIIVDNSEEGFSKKMKKIGEAVFNVVGIPSSIQFYKKYLLKQFDHSIFPEDLKMERFLIEDTILTSDDKDLQRRIRRRGQNDSYSYTLVEKYINDKDDKKDKVEITRRITARDYMELFSQKDPRRRTLKKTKITFVTKNMAYNFEEYDLINIKVQLVVIQSERCVKSIKVPGFFEDKIIREVTNESDYHYENMTLQDWKLPSKDLIAIYQ